MKNYRQIVTELPHPSDLELIEKLKKYESRSMHGQLPIVWDKAKDSFVYDRHGNVFIDFTSTICLANIGHANSYIRMAIGNMLNKPLLHSYTFVTEPRYGFLKYLIEECYPGGKGFLVSAGTEATEVACKLMRMYGQQKDPNRRLIVSFKGAMHGRTMLTEQLKGITENNLWAFSFDSGVVNLEIEEKIEHLEEQKKKICGIIIESYQGWSARFFQNEYIQNLVKWAKNNDILVCFDEIQSGFGRTGKMFAWEHYGIEKPDLICCGKGISSSLPLSAVIGRADLLDLPEVGSMSSTHSANPLSCVAGLINLWRLKEDNLVEEARKNGEFILNEWLAVSFDENKIEAIQGKGMVWAIITKTTEEADRIVWECFKRGLLLIWTHKNSVKIAPPLNIDRGVLLEGLEIIKEVLKGGIKNG
jgi:4-aminobutyrate aminotransferase / (S)-3-amino-2-methylpropionate transaminase / 5-aminovalerate transaminase